MNCFQIATVIGLRLFFMWRNMLADRGRVVIEGDPDFRYSL